MFEGRGASLTYAWLQTKCQHSPRSSTFLWTIKRRSALGSGGIESRGPPSYFFGTIHVPYSQVWDSVPNRVKQAFKASDSIYFELDLMDAYTVSTLAKCQLLPNRLRLIDILPHDLYQRLRKHLEYVRLMLPDWVTSDQKARGLYAEYLYNAITSNWQRKRPVWVMLMVNSLNEIDIKSRGIPVLDLYLAQEAQRLNKKIGSIEKVKQWSRVAALMSCFFFTTQREQYIISLDPPPPPTPASDP